MTLSHYIDKLYVIYNLLEQDDWLSDRLPDVWAQMGPDAAVPLWQGLQGLAYEDGKLAVLVAGLLKIAQSHPDQFEATVRQFVNMLDAGTAEHADLNAYIVLTFTHGGIVANYVCYIINLIVSYLLTQGETMSRLIAHWQQGHFVYLVSPQMVTELKEVVNRPRLRRYMQADPAVLLELIEADAELTPGKLVLTDVCRDPKDDQFRNRNAGW